MGHSVKLTFDGQEGFDIDCGEHEDVVTAALRQGYILLTECREGICATCRGYLESGKYDSLLPHTPDALSPADEEEGYILACRLRPRSDLVIDFDYPVERVERFEEHVLRGQIVALERVAETVVRMVVRTLAAHGPVQYLPGQFMRLTLAATGVSRDFSMANEPNDDRTLEFLIKIIPGGEFSGYIAERAREGELINVEGPFGSFTLRPTDRTPVFVAGGTGVAPIAAMLRRLCRENPEQDAVLVFGNTNPGDVFYTEELAKLGASFAGLRTYVTLLRPETGWEGETGLVTDVLQRVIAEPQQHEFYLCGPPPMLEATRSQLLAAGVDRRVIHQETFIPSGR